MSKVGKQPIIIPEGVNISIENKQISVSGPKGELKFTAAPDINISKQNGHLLVDRLSESKLARSLHGLSRTLISNMVSGVTDGWSKELELVGVGYKASITGNDLVLSVGFSHPVVVTPPADIKLEVKDNNKIIVSGIDKAEVGQLAAKIRKIRPPEPYKGKGIKYIYEKIRRKAGKAAKTG